MKRIVVAVVLLCGCVPTIEPTYSGKVSIQRQNGNVVSIEITFPSSTTIRSRQEAEVLTAQLEALLSDFKSAKDEFIVEEKP